MKKLNIICLIIAVLGLGISIPYYVYRKWHEDVTPPVILMENNRIECTIDAGPAELVAGLTANDEVDGDLTSHIMVNDIHIKDDEDAAPNEFDITYVVFDSSSNMTFATRTLVYTDYHSPHFTISDKLRFNAISSVNLYSCLGAEDCIDGDISGQVTIEMGNAYLNAISYGVYDFIAYVTNSVGDSAEIPLTFEIYDSTTEEEANKPDIVLTDYLTYIQVNSDFVPEEYLKGVIIDGYDYWLVDIQELYDETTREEKLGFSNANYSRFLPYNAIGIETNLDTTTPGTYTVIYLIQHPEKGYIGTARLIVIVE